MKKSLMGVGIAIGVGMIWIGTVKADASSNLLYRIYNPNSGEHFYTENAGEKDDLTRMGWHEEGIAWFTPDTGIPVYRLYNPNSGDHHYTLSLEEYHFLEKIGWKGEGQSFYSADDNTLNRQAIYRAYNPNEKIGSHTFTANKSEQDYLTGVGWIDEGIAFYGNDVLTDKEKNNLVMVINEAKALKENRYTANSWAEFAVGLSHAQNILTADNSTKDLYVLTAKRLREDMNNLVVRANPFELRGALERYADYSKVPEYTSNPAWKEVEKLYPEAKRIYEDTNVPQDEVTSIARKLTDALLAVMK